MKITADDANVKIDGIISEKKGEKETWRKIRNRSGIIFGFISVVSPIVTKLMGVW